MIDEKFLENPHPRFRPDVRWWLSEGAHTRQTLERDIALLDRAGFGAAEFLAMDEPGVDSAVYGWGSAPWVRSTQVITEALTKRGMGVSFTSGTNWSNANLTTIVPDHRAAAKELDYALEVLAAGETRTGPLPRAEITVRNVFEQVLIGVVAVRELPPEAGESYLDMDTARVLTGLAAEGKLTWTAPPNGTYRIFYFWMHGTGQTAAPSAGISYTVNYLDRYGVEALIGYWDRAVLTPGLQEQIRQNHRPMMYMDSLELSTYGKGGQLWGYHFLEEFQSRRGYDLTPWLPLVLKNAGMETFVYQYRIRDRVLEEKIHNDLYQTMTELYMDCMLKPMQDWLHSRGMTLRAEISYGLPFEISQPGKYVDGIETESLEFCSQIESYRNLAGPAHVYNRIYSSETGATRLNYVLGMNFYNQIIYAQFAGGVTRTVLHGYASVAGGEGSADWPGHEGMWPVFSERFGERQPAFRHYRDWTGMLSRYQKLLRQGQPRMDLCILRFDYNFNNTFYRTDDERDFYENRGMRGGEGCYWRDMSLQYAGYTWDYLAPQLLEEAFVGTAGGCLLPEGPAYQAILVYQEMLPLRAARKLLELARAGQPILFVNGVTETLRLDLPKTHARAAAMTPFRDGLDSQLREVVRCIKAQPSVRETDSQKAVCAVLRQMGIRPRIEPAVPDANLLTLMRATEEETYVYVYNMMYTQEEDHTALLSVAGGGKPYRADCWSGKLTELGGYTRDGRTVLPVTLAPGEAALFVLDVKGRDERYPRLLTGASPRDARLLKLDGQWTLETCAREPVAVRFSDGACFTARASVPEPLLLEEWELSVEDWQAGEMQVLEETGPSGQLTREVFCTTEKTLLHAGSIKLAPWKDIPAIGAAVSGVGHYTARVLLTPEWVQAYRTVLKIGSICGNTAAVYVNGKKADAFDWNSLYCDITRWVHAGENRIQVEVSSTLNNRLLASGYYDDVAERSMQRCNAASGGTEEDPALLSFFEIRTDVQDYGMLGPVKLIPYQRIVLPGC